MVQGAPQEVSKQGAEAREGRGITKILGGEGYLCEILAWDVAAADPKVMGQIPEYVCHLETLAEAHPTTPHSRRIPSEEGRTMGHGHLRPELAHAPGRVVRILVQVRQGFKGDDPVVVFSGKPP